MTTCGHCSRPSQLFLCNACQTDLRDMLIGLARGQQLPNGQYAAGWLESLADAALGKTRFGSSERRTPRYRRPLDGESSLASQIELLPGEHWETIEGPARDGESWPLKVPLDVDIDLPTARRQRMNLALQHALGAARINLRASELLDYTRSVLVEWIRDICETRGVEVPAIAEVAEMALWLAKNVSAIASDEAADVCLREIREIVRDIEQVIDRPASRRYCGPCPAVVKDGDGRDRVCGTALKAHGDDVSVECMARNCRATHNVEELFVRQINTTDGYLFTMDELAGLVLPAVGEYVPRRTLQHWVAKRRLHPRDHTLDGEPKYLLADVRKLRDEKPQTAPTGAAAEKRKACC